MKKTKTKTSLLPWCEHAIRGSLSLNCYLLLDFSDRFLVCSSQDHKDNKHRVLKQQRHDCHWLLGWSLPCL